MKKEFTKILLFDTECLMCNRFIQFILKKDINKSFQFGSFQGKFASQILEDHSIKKQETIILYDNSRVFIKSSAVLRCFKQFKYPWKFLYILIYIPRIIRDYIYDIVSNNRHKLMKDSSSCMIITPELKKRFIDD